MRPIGKSELVYRVFAGVVYSLKQSYRKRRVRLSAFMSNCETLINIAGYAGKLVLSFNFLVV